MEKQDRVGGNEWKANGVLSRRQKVTIESYMRRHQFTFLFCVAVMATLFCGVLIGETSKISPILQEINGNLSFLAKEQIDIKNIQHNDSEMNYMIHSRLYYRIDSLGEELRRYVQLKK